MYLIGPFYAGPNLTPALFTPALIPPLANFRLTPLRAAYNAGENEKRIFYLLFIFCSSFIMFIVYIFVCLTFKKIHNQITQSIYQFFDPFFTFYRKFWLNIWKKTETTRKKITPLFGKNSTFLALITPAFLTPALLTPHAKK